MYTIEVAGILSSNLVHEVNSGASLFFNLCMTFLNFFMKHSYLNLKKWDGNKIIFLINDLGANAIVHV